MSIIIQQHCLHTKPLIFLLLWGHIILWGEEIIHVLASDRWCQVFSSFSFSVRVSLVKFQPVLILFCPFCSLSPLPSSAPSPPPAPSTSLQDVSLLTPPCTSFQLLKPWRQDCVWLACLGAAKWRGKVQVWGLVTPDINKRFSLGCCLGLLAGASSLLLLLFAAFSLPFPSPQLQSSGLVLLIWKYHVMIVLLTKYSAVRNNSLGQPAGMRLKA